MKKMVDIEKEAKTERINRKSVEKEKKEIKSVKVVF